MNTTTTPSVIELATTTKVAAMVCDGEWTVAELSALPCEFRALVWSGHSVRLARVTTEPVPGGQDMDVHKVTVGGVKVRCSARSNWTTLKKGEPRSTLAGDLKAGDHVPSHPKFGRDALHNLTGYPKCSPVPLAQVKTAHEDVPLTALSVKGGGAILLGNGIFVG